MNAPNLTGTALANGGAKRRDLDFYPTPANVTHALCQFLTAAGVLRPTDTVWEPACGEGHMAQVLAEYTAYVISTDIADTGYADEVVDFLGDSSKLADAIITNPPFSLSEGFIRKAIDEAPVVAMLLKSQYWHASKRTKLFNQHPPAFVLPLNWRPDFYMGAKGGSPTMEVAWSVWVEGAQYTRYKILQKPAEAL